jgi:hypothetical protein
MQTQLATLFRLDQRGRMLCENEPDDPPAPRLFLGQTREGNIWAVRHDLPDSLAAEIERICAAEPVAEDLEAPPRFAAALRSLLGAGSKEWHGPAFVIPEALSDVHGAMLIGPGSTAELAPHFGYLGDAYAALAPIAAALDGGVVVSACWCSRIGAHAAEAGVETLASHRGRGHGLAAVATWAHAVRARGLTPLYSTSWDNMASRSIARRLGMALYGADWSIY